MSRPLHRLVLAACLGLSAAQAACAVQGQPGYDASLARVHTFVRLQALGATACAKRFPDEAARFQATHAQWVADNGAVIQEVEAHWRAMLVREARARGQSMMVFGAKLDAGIDGAIMPTLKMVDAPDEALADRSCGAMSQALKSPQSRLETRYAAMLAVIRACRGNGTCPDLAPGD